MIVEPAVDDGVARALGGVGEIAERLADNLHPAPGLPPWRERPGQPQVGDLLGHVLRLVPGEVDCHPAHRLLEVVVLGMQQGEVRLGTPVLPQAERQERLDAV